MNLSDICDAIRAAGFIEKQPTTVNVVDRAYAAIQIAAGLSASESSESGYFRDDQIAARAVRRADALMVELKKTAHPPAPTSSKACASSIDDETLSILIKTYECNPSLLCCTEIVECLKSLQEHRAMVRNIVEWHRCDMDDDIANDARRLYVVPKT